MKKAILIVVVIGMLGWAVYDFVISSNQGETADSVEESEEVSNDKATSSSPEEEVEEEEEVDTVVDSDVEGLNKGQMAPDFELTTLDGETVKLSDFRGKRVMLNFWATWCPPCRAEMPDMQRFHEDKDVVILAVNLRETETNTQKVQDFIDERDLTFQILLDEKTAVANRYQIQPIPSSFMIDSDGRIQNKAFGALNYDLMVQEFERMH